jgi:nitrite reductase/ring-hydroxylating ferredoxin subunit
MPEVRLCRLDALPAGRPILREGAGRRLAVVRVGKTVHAVDDECPHAGGPLSEGAVLDGSIICPYHTWMFDLVSGACVAGGRTTSVSVFRTRITGDEVWVELP